MAYKQIGIAFFSGLSTDTKPTLDATNTGATFYTTDTKKLWIYDDTTAGWTVALEPLHIIAKGNPLGDADLTTIAKTSPTDGDYYTATVPGDYTLFHPPTDGLKGVAKGDILIWDGSKWTIEANSNLIHHTNGMVSTPEATIAAISGGGNKVLVTKEYVLSSAIGAMEYKGTWDASTNTPTLSTPSSDPTTGNKGHFYIVSVGGTQTLPPSATPTNYIAGDWVMSDGTNWDKVSASNSVASVFGRTGVIVADGNDYAAFYEDFLHNPTIDDQVLSSKINGTRSWVGYSEIAGLQSALDDKANAIPLNTDNGDATLTTPATPLHVAKGDYYTATVDGKYTTFIPPTGGIDAKTGDHLVWDGSKWIIQTISVLTSGLEKFADTTTPANEGWKFIDNPSTVTGDNAVNLMPIGDAIQDNIVYVGGLKYKSYTTGEVSALVGSQLGTVLFDSDKNQLVQCIDETVGAIVWATMGGELTRVHQALRPGYNGTLTAGTKPAYTFAIDTASGDVTANFPHNSVFILEGGGFNAQPYTVDNATFAAGATTIHFKNPYLTDVPAYTKIGEQDYWGWKVASNPSIITGESAVNLMIRGDALQPDMTYVGGVKYKSYSTAAIAALPGTEAGTLVYDSDKNVLQVYDGTTWVDLGGSIVEYPTIIGNLISGATSFKFLTDLNKEFTVEQGGTIQTLTGTGANQTVTGVTDASEITIVLSDTATKFWFKDDMWESFNLKSVGHLTELESSFSDLTKMTTFECDADMSGITTLAGVWGRCSGLTSFPLIDTRSVSNFGDAWRECTGLKDFPKLDTISGTNFSRAWIKCSGLTSFPDIKISGIVQYTWSECTGFTHFPYVDLSDATDILHAWSNCTNMVSIAEMDYSNVKVLSSAWMNCSKLACIGGTVDFSSVTGLSNVFTGCVELVRPAPVGTPIRKTNNALAGVWTNLEVCGEEAEPSGLEKTYSTGAVHTGTMAIIDTFVVAGDVASEYPLNTEVVLKGSPTNHDFYTTTKAVAYTPTNTNITLLDSAQSTDYTSISAIGDGWKLIANTSIITAIGSVNLMPTGDAPKKNLVYVQGTKYKSYTTVEIATLPDYTLGTFLFDSTLNSLVQCTDATAGANVWTPVGGGSAEKGGIAHSNTTNYVIGDIVTEAGKVYSCKTTHSAKAFDATEWDEVGGGGTAPSGLERIGNSYVYPGSLASVSTPRPVFVIDNSEGDVRSKLPVDSLVVLVGSPTAPDHYGKVSHLDFNTGSGKTGVVLYGADLAIKDYTGIRLAVGYKLIDNPSVVTGDGAVNLMPTGDAPQPNLIYVEGVKYKSYTTVEMAALPDSELGTFLFDSTLNSLVQCTDATAGANVWTPVGGGSAEKGGIAHSATTDYAVGDIVTEASKVYSCKTAHIAKPFNDADWDEVGGSASEPTPALVALTGTPTLADFNKTITYINALTAALKTAGVLT